MENAGTHTLSSAGTATETIVCSACKRTKHVNVAAGLCTQCLSVHLEHMLNSPGELRAFSADIPPGYQFVDCLGQGGMGVVYLVCQTVLNRYVALKQLNARWRQEPRAADRFFREATAAARLSHPALVKVLEAGVHNGVFWYTMEYVEGGDLSHLLQKKGGRLPWRMAVALVGQVARGLQHMHEAGVAHRDLKPSNILLDTNGSPKIGDFGLAWINGQEQQGLTATGEIVGTPSYLAPECLHATDTKDPKKADIYSLGALLFHLITGRPPFIAEHTAGLLHAIAREAAPPLKKILHEPLPPGLEHICRTCLDKSPARRFARASDVADALGRIVADEGYRADCPWWMVRRSLLITLALAAGCSLVLSVDWLAHREPTRSASNVKERLSPRTLAILPVTSASDSMQDLAGGFQEELVGAINRLTNIAVVSTLSTRRASERPEGLKSFRALGADVILTAAIRQWRDQLRISVQLQDTASERVLWAHTYERRETNLFNLQADIATDVALQLKGEISPEREDLERGSASKHPESQRLAYHARSLAADASASTENLTKAAALLSQATQLDPEFALAFAQLSQVHSLIYHWGADRSEQRLALAYGAAQTALRLNSKLPEAKLALAVYFLRGTRDYDTARPHVQAVLDRSPNSAEALEAMAQIERRSGNFERSSEFYSRAASLDPLNPILIYNTADTLLRLRRYDEASQMLELASARIGNHVALQKLRGDLFLLWKGDLSLMEQELGRRDPRLPTPELFLRDKITLLLLQRKFPEALDALRQSRFDRIEAQSIFLLRSGYEALLLLVSGEKTAARVSALSAWPLLRQELERRPNDSRVLLHAAEVAAAMGELGEAQRLGVRTLTPGDLACVDAFDRGFYQRSLAVAYASAGADEEALQLLRMALKDPNQISRAYVRMHPALSHLAHRL